MKLLATIALASGALLLSATGSTAGSRRPAASQRLGFLPRATTFAPTVQAAKKTAGFNCIVACADYESTINQYFTDVAADSGLTTNVYSVLPQYATPSSSILYSTTFDSLNNTYVDGNPYPDDQCNDTFNGYHDKYCLTDKQLQTEIGKVIAANDWPTQSQTAALLRLHAGERRRLRAPGRGEQSRRVHDERLLRVPLATANFIYAVEPDDAAVTGGNGCDSAHRPPATAQTRR